MSAHELIKDKGSYDDAFEHHLHRSLEPDKAAHHLHKSDFTHEK